LRGWTKEGIPTAKKLKELGLDFAVNDMKISQNS
jgi:aldehyde:ferredoxin oxidoreductase